MKERAASFFSLVSYTSLSRALCCRREILGDPFANHFRRFAFTDHESERAASSSLFPFSIKAGLANMNICALRPRLADKCGAQQQMVGVDESQACGKPR
jgi:hypothetical protein